MDVAVSIGIESQLVHGCHDGSLRGDFCIDLLNIAGSWWWKRVGRWLSIGGMRHSSTKLWQFLSNHLWWCVDYNYLSQTALQQSGATSTLEWIIEIKTVSRQGRDSSQKRQQHSCLTMLQMHNSCWHSKHISSVTFSHWQYSFGVKIHPDVVYCKKGWCDNFPNVSFINWTR